jgi:DNA-directed RNA polymerase subunit M/transcription elongation factor TFIIS
MRLSIVSWWNHMILKCPSCSAILYSRTSGICPECLTPLPKEFRLTDEEKTHREIEKEKLKVMVTVIQDTSKKKGMFKRFLGG